MKTIALRRRGLGMTQVQFAKVLGVTPLTVSRWETGNQNPPLKKLKRIADTLHCTLSDLLQD